MRVFIPFVIQILAFTLALILLQIKYSRKVNKPFLIFFYCEETKFFAIKFWTNGKHWEKNAGRRNIPPPAFTHPNNIKGKFPYLNSHY